MPVLSDEPALGFWLRYAEREGALVEEQRDQALVLLPGPLRDESELPEEATLTSDPDLAREDGAVLLIAGHPAIEKAAAAVLAEGDTGRAYLPWPGSRPPSRSALEARARDLVPVEHGRIDATGEPAAAYLPLLRVGAMISYAASLTLRFQEQEEAWVDARTGLAASDPLLAGVGARRWLPGPEGHRRSLATNVPFALAAAHERLQRRAIARQASLAMQARRELESELARADTYYDGARRSIEHRLATAADERARILEAQADAIAAERARRHREIREQFTPRHEIKPFRLHLVHVPAFVLPVDVRRGSHTFPFALTWLAGVDEFAAVRCPACEAPGSLVAGRDRLGCEACMPRTAARPEAPRAPIAPAPPVQRTDSSPVVPAPSVNRRSAHAERQPPEPRQRGQAGRTDARGARRPPGAGASRPVNRDAIERTGNKVALTFWQTVANGDRWPRGKAARDSPLRALYRLYGALGPLCAIGMPPGDRPDEVTASTYPSEPGAPELTLGSVIARGQEYRFSLYWWIEAGKAVVGEVMPTPDPLELPPARGPWAATCARLRQLAPAPTAGLDPVAAALWRNEVERAGLPFAVRCMATWWRAQAHADPAEPPAAVAAAVAGAVASAAAMRRSRAETAAIYATDPAAVGRASHELQTVLRLDRVRGW